MNLDVVCSETQKVLSQINLNDAVFAASFNESLVHQVVVAINAAARQGTKAQKTRAEVSGGGKKPWRQKGTGRARAGTTRGPLWRKGGVTFAAKPRDFAQKVNKKMYAGAMASVLSNLVATDRLLVVEALDVARPKTKDLVNLLTKLNLKDVLIVTDNISENLYLASRNLYQVGLCGVHDVDPVSLLAYEKILITASALKHFEEVLG